MEVLGSKRKEHKSQGPVLQIRNKLKVFFFELNFILNLHEKEKDTAQRQSLRA